MKKLLISLLVLVIIIATGCEQKYSLDQTLFIDSIGLDYNNEKNEYEIYYHIASSSTLLTNSLGGTSSETIYSIGKVSANSIYEGFNKITQNSIKNITLTHVQSMILNFNFITIENLHTICDIVKTYDYISPNFYIFATKSKLDDIYSLKNPENISPFFSLITGNDFVTAYDLTYLTEIARAMYEEFITPKLIVIEAKDNIWQNNDEKITSVAPIGNLYIKNNNEKVFLELEKYKAISVINHEVISTIVQDGISFRLHNNNIKIKEKNNKFKIIINGTFYATGINVNNRNQIKEYFNSFIKEEFEKIINDTKELDFDIFNLQDKLYRKSHFKDYDKEKSSFNYKATEIEIIINYKLLS